MQKNLMKTETVAEFMARGGEIKRVYAKNAKKTYSKVIKETIEGADFSMLPLALKIKYGIR